MKPFKWFGVAAVLLLLCSPLGSAQITGTKAGSAEAAQKIQEFKDRMAAQTPKDGELNVAGLEVGKKGRPTWINAKVMQVVDENQMLVGFEDARTGNGTFPVWVMLKAPTKGIVDGKFWRGEDDWKKITGFDGLAVTDTLTYKTAGGGSKTVFVLEGAKLEAKPKADPKTDASSNTTPAPSKPTTTAPSKPTPTPSPAPKAKPTRKKSVTELRAEVIAAGEKAMAMMNNEKVSEPVKAWVGHFVNRGFEGIPEVNAEDLKTAKSLLIRDEVLEWISAEHNYLLARSGIR